MIELTSKNNNDEIGFTNRTIILREKEGLTQSEFAEKINVSAVLISDIERKKKKLSLQNAVEINKVFNVSLDWLYELTEDTRDTASNIIDNMSNAFKIDFKEKTILIDDDLGDFLEKIFDAYEIKKEKNLPDEALKYWIDGIKKEYNERIKNNPNKNTSSKKYYLQDYMEHKRTQAIDIPFR